MRLILGFRVRVTLRVRTVCAVAIRPKHDAHLTLVRRQWVRARATGQGNAVFGTGEECLGFRNEEKGWHWQRCQVPGSSEKSRQKPVESLNMHTPHWVTNTLIKLDDPS